MCLTLLIMDRVMKDRGFHRHVKILGAAMIHALTTHAKSSRPLWEHLCDVMYPPEQHKDETALYHYVATCTFSDDNFQFGIVNPNNFGFRTVRIITPLDEFNGPLGYFLNHVDDMVESIRKWQTNHFTAAENAMGKAAKCGDQSSLLLTF